jgi:hypothetical protein
MDTDWEKEDRRQERAEDLCEGHGLVSSNLLSNWSSRGISSLRHAENAGPTMDTRIGQTAHPDSSKAEMIAAEVGMGTAVHPHSPLHLVRISSSSGKNTRAKMS